MIPAIDNHASFLKPTQRKKKKAGLKAGTIPDTPLHSKRRRRKVQSSKPKIYATSNSPLLPAISRKNSTKSSTTKTTKKPSTANPNSMTQKSTQSKENQRYMMPKDEHQLYFSKKEIADMRKAHLKMVFGDCQTLRNFLYPSVKSHQPYDVAMKRASRDRTQMIFENIQILGENYNPRKSVAAHQRLESRSQERHTNTCDQFSKNLEYVSQQRWRLFVRNFGGNDEQEYLLHRMRKKHEARTAKDAIEKFHGQMQKIKPYDDPHRGSKRFIFSRTEVELEVKKKFGQVHDADDDE